MATLEPDSPTTEVKLVPKLFHNFVGVYQPTDALLEYVQASVPQLKNIQNVHRVFEIDPAILLRSLDPIATDNSPYFVIPLNRMFEDTRKLIRPIWKEFRDFYYPEVGSSSLLTTPFRGPANIDLRSSQKSLPSIHYSTTGDQITASNRK